MNPIQATDDKYLILKDQFEGQVNAARPPLHTVRWYDFWDNRYFCIPGIHDEKFWRFDIFDFLTNESKSVRFQKSSDQFQRVDTYFLSYQFVIIIEKDYSLDLCYVTLVKLNWESGVLEALEHIERHDSIVRIFVDPLNQSKFVLSFSTHPFLVTEYQDCKLVNGKIEFGTMLHQRREFYSQCLDDKLIGIENLGRKFRIKTYNMVDRQEKSFETKLCPRHVILVDEFLSRTWVVDCLYVPIWFRDFRSYGLMWADAETRHWNILDFSTNMRIRGLHFFNGTLIVSTKQAGTENEVFKSIVKVYEISICRPQSLRQKAWLRVIRNLKRKGHLNPYKEAARYLPLNTDLRPHWFEDVEEEAPDEQGNDMEKGNSDGIQETSLDQGGDKDVEKETHDKQDDKQGNDVNEKAVQAKFADLSV